MTRVEVGVIYLRTLTAHWSWVPWVNIGQKFSTSSFEWTIFVWYVKSNTNKHTNKQTIILKPIRKVYRFVDGKKSVKLVHHWQHVEHQCLVFSPGFWYPASHIWTLSYYFLPVFGLNISHLHSITKYYYLKLFYIKTQSKKLN